MARKSLVAVVLAAGLSALGCGEQKTAMLTPGSAIVATAAGSVSPADGLAAAFELGNAYRMMASVGYDSIDSGAADATSINLGFTYYLKAIENNDKPIGLQEFFGSKGKAYADLSMVSNGSDDTVWEVGGNYRLPQMGEKLVVGAAVNGQEDVFGWQVGAAYNIRPDLTAGVSYSSEKNDATDETTKDIGLDVRYAVELGGRWLDAALGVDFLDVEGTKDTAIGLDLTYYVMKQLGINLVYGMSSGDSPDVTAFGGGAKYYYGPLALGVSYLTMDVGAPDNINTLSISAEYRF